MLAMYLVYVGWLCMLYRLLTQLFVPERHTFLLACCYFSLQLFTSLVTVPLFVALLHLAPAWLWQPWLTSHFDSFNVLGDGLGTSNWIIAVYAGVIAVLLLSAQLLWYHGFAYATAWLGRNWLGDLVAFGIWLCGFSGLWLAWGGKHFYRTEAICWVLLWQAVSFVFALWCRFWLQPALQRHLAAFANG